MKETIFELKNVYYYYLGKFPALRGIDLSVNAGEKIAIIGANGTGKSTLLTLLDGLVFPDSGIIKAFGKELSENTFFDEEFSRLFRSKVGFVFQNPDIQLFCPTVREDIMFGPLQLGVSHSEIKKRLSAIAESLDIKELLGRAPHQLSIGEKRKAALAGVLIMEPDVIMLDEPTAGLDPMTTRHIIDMILDLNLSGKTIITATHDMQIIGEISDMVYVFDKTKKIVKSASPADILSDEEFLKQNNLVHIHSHKHQGKTHTHPHMHLEHHH
jgi:cobalt/nickel transport system ATP-binding protein